MGSEDGENLSVSVTDSAGISESAFVDKMDAEGATTGVVASRGGPDGRFAAAEIDDAGNVTARIEGRASPKVSSELRAAGLLVAALNQRGEQWVGPTAPPESAPEEGVDCVAVGPGGEILKIQITTPEVVAWPKLARSAEPWVHSETVEPLIEALWAAVHKKHLKAHPDIHLVLDATDSVRFALSGVVERFREEHGSQARGRFASVWVAGPIVDLVFQLDT